MAERILMNEYKNLAKEKWVNIEVCTLESLRSEASANSLIVAE